ncbi:S49 family peptidase [Halorientalis pallida]|uniref:S49 family peptidase n=1 Tax=Halorientalis pallida TaxID=2479928 RepID=A0A498KY97_9EURY|nr:S49 family peptidase [Halorientalis pallida]RXK50560.1 S49 family peptidase [Halorientalis pallida]
MNRDSGPLDRIGGPVVVFGVVGLLVGAALVPYAWGASTGPDGTVAVVEVHGTINGDTAAAAMADLREARQNDSIQAVVLDVNSRGGLASVSEQLYLSVKQTSEDMPVMVAVTGSALSGGYYTSAPADSIYVTPASTVGSVGVRAVVPPRGAPDNQITTGPDKTTTATQAEARRRVEALRRAFVGSVVAERNTSLSASELSYAKVYSGSRGTELGLADEVGGLDAAISAAADEAGLSDYETVRMESPTASPLSQIGLNASGDATVDVDTTQYFMLHGQLDVSDSAAQIEVTVNGTN